MIEIPSGAQVTMTPLCTGNHPGVTPPPAGYVVLTEHSSTPWPLCPSCTADMRANDPHDTIRSVRTLRPTVVTTR